MSILNEVETWSSQILQAHTPPNMLYHNLDHTLQTVARANTLATKSGVANDEKEDLLIAAWIHDIGYTKTYEGHEDESIRMGSEFLRDKGMDEQRVQRIMQIVAATKSGAQPASELEKMMVDADRGNIGKKDFFEKGNLLRREWSEILGKNFPDEEWEKLQLEFLETHKFQTSHAVEKWEPRRLKNIQKQMEALKAVKRKKARDTRPRRGIETMYRSVYRTHIDLSSIADSKANMMISINTIMMSIVVASVGSGFTFTGRSFIEHVRFTIPLCVLVFGGLISVVFAILSASPKVTSKKVTKRMLEKNKSSSLFFGNFTTLERDEFVEELRKLRQAKDDIYDSMTVDIYYLGVVLRKKYAFLKISYMVFMFSLILTVLTFILLLIFSW